MSMLRNLLQVQSQAIEAEKRTLIIASLKLVLFFILLSFCLTEILLITGDSLLYTGKDQSVAWYWFLSLYSLGMILDASYVLGKKTQTPVVGNRRGIAGTLLQLFVLTISPMRFFNLVSLAAVMGMIGCAISFLAVIFYTIKPGYSVAGSFPPEWFLLSLPYFIAGRPRKHAFLQSRWNLGAILEGVYSRGKPIFG